MTGQMNILRITITLSLLGFASLSACGSNDSGNGTPTNTGASCAAPSECFPGVDHDALSGPVQCLDRVSGGYCTHDCVQDSDCCAVSGECPLARPEVCAPFESTGDRLCFLSCESADVKAAGFADDTTYCQHYTSAAFICRSTGGGSDNRKVCVPN